MHTAFFGDGEKTFALTSTLIRELERTTGYGIGALFERIRSRLYSQHDLFETIRLGLIGGGTAPQEAVSLISTYAVDRPLSESLAIAVNLLAVVMFGADDQADEGQEAGK
jgi:hypothetical protein